MNEIEALRVAYEKLKQYVNQTKHDNRRLVTRIAELSAENGQLKQELRQAKKKTAQISVRYSQLRDSSHAKVERYHYLLKKCQGKNK